MNYEILHIAAMNLIEEAILEKAKGNLHHAYELLLQALQLEKSAANLAKKELEETTVTSLLFKSAANVAFDVQNYEEANLLAVEGLHGNPISPVKEELLEIVEKSSSKKNHLSATDITKIEKIEKLFRETPENRHTILRLEKQFEISRFKLKKGFKLLYGDNIANYLLKIRMELARNYLQNTNYSLTDVANRVGYEEPTSFVREYKKYFSKVPSIERKLSKVETRKKS